MPSNRRLRIFLSSPGDVAEERRLAQIVIERLKYDRELRDSVTLETIAWDDPKSRVPFLANMKPQDAINAGLALPSECDVVIVILWSRMGTPFEYKGKNFDSGTHFEFIDAIQAAEHHQGIQPAVLLYRRTQKPTITVDDPEQAIKQVEQYRLVTAFFESRLFHDEYNRILRGYNPYKTPEQFEDYLENDLKKTVKLLLSRVPSDSQQLGGEVPPVPLWEGSPFVGLRALTEADEPIFFGRTRETAEVIDLIRRQRFVTIVGSSGSGKSSLVGAGVIPKLRTPVIEEMPFWVIIRFTPGELGTNPLIALADRVRSQGSARLSWQNAADLAGALAKEPAVVEQMVQEVLAGSREGTRLLLFIDQFEELLTLADETPRQQFIQVLAQAVRCPQLTIITTLRADFFHRMVEHEALAKLLNEGNYSLSAPGSAALLEMIVRPADRAGLMYEEALPQRILDDTGSDPGALALLAFALDELYTQSMTQDEHQLTRRAYEGIGTVQGAIAKRASDTFDSLSADGKAAMPRVFQELVKIDDQGTPTRQRTRLVQFDTDPPAQELIGKFVEKRLLTTSKTEEDLATVEVAHEALLRSWDRLAKWIAGAQDDLRLQDAVKRAAVEWDEHERDPDYLWTASRITEANAMIVRCEWHPSSLVREFLKSETERWLEILSRPDTPTERRVEIGLQLAVLPDPRPGVGVLPNGIPDIAWAAVEGEAGAFKVARYPVTVQQYRAFLRADDGFQSDQWWKGLIRPTEPPKATSTFDNYPMNAVNWYEAVAFCRWLSAKTGEEIRLLSTAERSALVPEAEEADGDELRGNTLEAKLRQAVTVGLFPADDPTLSLYDLRGNIREWGMSAIYPGLYPRTGAASSNLRVLYGQSWNRLASSTPDIMCANAGTRSAEWGFRLAAGPSISQDYEQPIEDAPSADTTAEPAHGLGEDSVGESGAALPYRRRNLPEWVRMLPRIRFRQQNLDFQLINKHILQQLLKDVRPDIVWRVSEDVEFAETELLRLFRQRDFNAAYHLNRFHLTELLAVILVLTLVIIGSFTLWTTITNPAMGVVLAFVSTVITLLLVYLLAVRGQEPAYPIYMSNRIRAEFLRREYFRYLIGLPPYHLSNEGVERKRTFAMRVADMNRGSIEADASIQSEPGQPRFLRYDRETDEVYYRLFDEFSLIDVRNYYRAGIQRMRRALGQCNTILATSLLLAGLSVSLSAVLSTTNPDSPLPPYLILVALISAGVAIFFLILPLLYQWERLIVVFDSSLEGLEVADAQSPMSEMDDTIYRVNLETYAEEALRVMEQETAQFGQLYRSPRSFTSTVPSISDDGDQDSDS